MKSLSILKTLIHIYYYSMLIAFGLGLIITPILLFTRKKHEISFLGDTIILTGVTTWKSIVILALIGSIFFVYFRSIQLIKKSVDHISTGTYFTAHIADNFKRIGNLFMVVGIGTTLVKTIIPLILKHKIGIRLDTSLFIFIILGLFFLFLSEAFEKANQLNEENKLTI